MKKKSSKVKKKVKKFVWREAFVNKDLLQKKMREKGYEVCEPKETSKDGILVKCRRKVYV